MSDSREVTRVISRLDEAVHRHSRTAVSRAVEMRRRPLSRTRLIQRAVTAGIVLALVLIGTTVAGIVLGGIGLMAWLAIIALTVIAVAALTAWPESTKVADYKDDMPNRALVQRLDTLLVQKRAALPPAAGRRLDAIGAQLPMLESQLADTAILDPLAQDARRLMGRHLPDLIERYESVPAAYRGERDGEGLTVDDRLIQGLDAAATALDELARKLVRDDVDAFRTQGRFIESRYKDADGPIQSE
jgi:hypothetical protein